MRTLVRLLSRLYPQSWRRRYGEEFDALLEELDPGWLDVIDVLKGALKVNRLRWVVTGMISAGAGASAAMAFFYFAHHHSQYVSAATAQTEFQRIRLRFSGQKPLLDMRMRRPLTNANSLKANAPVHTLNTIIFDTRGGQRLVRITVPYRLGRVLGRRSGFRWLGELTFLDDTEFDPEPIRLSLEQIVQRGPGLLVDYSHPSGGQFIAWTE